MCTGETQIVVGVDGCRSGWICFELERPSTIRVGIQPSFQTLRSAYEKRARIIAIDVPIGLVEAGSRKCDLAARKLLGKPRSNSVFPAPPRAALRATTYPEACELSRTAHGTGLSRQTFGILRKIREVDQVMTPRLQDLFFEVHPEVCFWALNSGRPMQHSKSSPTGKKERLELLARCYPTIGELLARVNRKRAAPDDLLDAAAAAWTAERIADGAARRVVQCEEVDSKGLSMNIFY
jgi:predicted RNase H-like nuclease